MIQRLLDLWLEIRINWAMHNFLEASDREERLLWAREMKRLHGLRSWQQIERMERRQGLR